MRSTIWHPGVAAVLSLVIPGLGQVYKGWIVRGLLFLLLTVIGYTLGPTLIFPGLVLHLWVIVDAYRNHSKAEHEAILRA